MNWEAVFRMSAKITDIAREAGVSTATVGRVLHKNGYVSLEARQRVEAAVKKLGYVPNAMARALKVQRSGIIGSLVMGSLNNLYQKINGFVSEAAERRGLQHITIQIRPDRRDEGQAIRQFIGMRIDGLAVISDPRLTPEHFALLRAESIPTVAIERTYLEPFVDNIAVRDLEGAQDAASRFLRRGHRRVALIAKEGDEPVERARLEGFQRAMEEAGVPRERQLIRLTPAYSAMRGKLAMEELLALPVPPTGVFCTADTLAAGALQALQQEGLRVPEDVSVAGYDNMLASQLAPPIDSVDLDLGGIGETLFSLLDRRRREPDCPARTETIGTVYVSRGTIKRQ